MATVRLLTLWVERDCAVLELVEGGVVVFVYANEFLLQSLEFVLVLWVLVDQLLKLGL